MSAAAPPRVEGDAVGRRPVPAPGPRLPPTHSINGLDRVEALRADMAARAAGIHAAQAELVALVGQMTTTEDAWAGPGIASIGHWGSIQMGLPARVVNDMADTASYLTALPLLSAEFSSGRLGFDKVRAIAAVATPEMEPTFIELALHGSVEQLRRITRAYAREHPEDDKTRNPDKPGPTPESRRRNRGLWCDRNPDGDGLVRLVAKLAPEDAALVMAAIKAHAEAQWRDENGDPPDDETRTEGPTTDGDRERDGQGDDNDPADTSTDDNDPDDTSTAVGDHESGVSGYDGTGYDGATSDEASTADARTGHPTSDDATTGSEDGPSFRDLNPSVPGAADDSVDPKPFQPRPARLADALVGLARTGLAEGPTPVTDGEPAEMVLHVNRDFLAGENDTGVCQADFGPTIPRSAARRLACDCRITTMVQDALGRPLGIGRASRTVPRWLRRALRQRDGGCVFPGCSHVAYVEAHHIWHWANGGPTDIDNLVLVCTRHHTAIHEHHLRVVLLESHRVEIQHSDGTPIMAPPQPASPDRMPRPRPDPGSDPRARDGGDPRWSLDLTLSALGCVRRATAPPG